MVVLLHAYLVEVVQPTGAMPREIECIGLLNSIIDIMKLGAHRSMPHIERLKSLLHAHHTLYTTLYQTVPFAFKPKYHQALHIPSNMETWNILRSCWTTEHKKQRLESSVWHCLHSHGTRHDVNHGCAADRTLRTEPSRDARHVYAHRSSPIVNRGADCHFVACAPSVRPRARR